MTPARGLHDCQRLLEAERARARAIEVVRLCRGGAPNPDLSGGSADEVCRRLLAGKGDLESVARCARVFARALRI